MTQIAISFVDTRSRRTDPQTSKDAAKFAASTKAQRERAIILQALSDSALGMTAREIAATTCLDYIEVQRRISEVEGIEKSGDRRDGCMVWRALGAFFSPQAQRQAVTPDSNSQQQGCDHYSARGAYEAYQRQQEAG